eukprot:SAG11_NODE_1095_length_5887_cov_1.491189_2_plen_876_part_00
MLEKTLKHERLQKVTIVWMQETEGELTELAQELLKLQCTQLDEHEYYRLHHCVDFSERQRASWIRQQRSEGHSSSSLQVDYIEHTFRARKNTKRKHKRSRTLPVVQAARGTKAMQLVIGRSMLCYPISFALKISDICHEVANSEDRADKADAVLEVADTFENIAVRVFNECPNEYVAERVLRGSKPKNLLGGDDLFTWMINLDEQPQQFIRSKWSQNYIAKIWCHADLYWHMHDSLYFGLEDRNSKPDASAPCDWTQELEQHSMLFYFYDWNTYNQLYWYAAKTLVFLPFMLLVDTTKPNRNNSKIVQEVARIKLFWSTPKVKYTFHNLSWIMFLIVLALYCVHDNPARSGNWEITTFTEIYVYLYIVAHTLSECAQVARTWNTEEIPRTNVAYCKVFVRELSDHISSSFFNGLDAVIIVFFVAMLPFRIYLAIKACQQSPDCALTQEYLDVADFGFATSPPAHIILNVLLSGLVLFCFLRAYIVIISHQTTGVLIIALFKMVDDVAVYVIIQLVGIFAFAFAFLALYPSSAGLPWHTARGSLHATLMAIFGEYDMADYESGSMFQSNSGALLFVAFQTATTIMLINLLIAMMSHTYDNVQDQALNQWLVEKAQIMQDYTVGIHNPVDLPPLNLVATPVKFLYRSILSCQRRRHKTGPDVLMETDDIDVFEKGVFGESLVLRELQRRRYCPSVEVRKYRDKQIELIEKIKDQRDRRLEHNKLMRTSSGRQLGPIAEYESSGLWAELRAAYQAEQRELSEGNVHYVRQIFSKPSMTGLSNVSGGASPFDHDFTVERTFPVDDDDNPAVPKSTATSAEEAPRKKQSLYQNYLDTLAEENSEQPATEDDVERLLVGKITDIQDQVAALQRAVQPKAER